MLFGRIGKQSGWWRCDWAFMRSLFKLRMVFQGEAGREWQALAMWLGTHRTLGSPITRDNSYHPRGLRGLDHPKACLKTEICAGMGTGCRIMATSLQIARIILNVIEHVEFF